MSEGVKRKGSEFSNDGGGIEESNQCLFPCDRDVSQSLQYHFFAFLIPFTRNDSAFHLLDMNSDHF